MGKPNFDPNADKPNSKSSSGDVPQEAGNIVNELRKMISDLKSEKNSTPNTPTKEPTEDPNLDFSQQIEEAPAPQNSLSSLEDDISGKGDFSERMGDAGIAPKETKDQPEPVIEKPKPSNGGEADADSDFWSGNVLGWPKEDEDIPAKKEVEPPVVPQVEPSEAKPPELKQPEPSMEMPEPEAPVDPFPPSPGPGPSEEIPEEMVTGEPAAFPPTNEPVEPPVAPPPFEPNLFSAEPPPPPSKEETEDLGLSTNLDLSSLDNLISEGPSSPSLEEPEPTPEEKALFDESKSMGQLFDDPGMGGAPSSGLEDPPISPSESLPKKEDLEPPIPEVPIPGTIESREVPKVAEESSPDLNLGSENPSPKGVLQVSCVFPKGQESKGQKFISQLREAGIKYKRPLDIQAVFIQSWEKKAIDFSAWEKSASLSGSQFIFLIIPRKDKALFKDQMDSLKRGYWKGRIVFLEQLTLKTLYTDILSQLGRVVK